MINATGGKVVGTELALDTTNASEVKAGRWYAYNSSYTYAPYIRSYDSYSRRTNSYTRTYSSGRSYSWSNFNRGGYSYTRYGYGSR